MPAERVSMRQAREIIRLKFSASLPTREIARRLGLAPSTVRETLSRLESWAFLAVAGRDRRRRTGGGALRQSQKQTGTPPPCRAGLARGPSRVEAQARHSADRLGRIYRRQPRRLQLLALCCGPAYVAEPSERAGLPGMGRNINSSGGAGDYRAFRNVISEGSGRCHGLVCTPDISTRASAFAFISMSTSA